LLAVFIRSSAGSANRPFLQPQRLGRALCTRDGNAVPHLPATRPHSAKNIDIIDRKKTEKNRDTGKRSKTKAPKKKKKKKTKNKKKSDTAAVRVTHIFTPEITAEETRRKLEATRISVEANHAVAEDEQWDISMVAEYGDEIFEYMRSMEEQMKPKASYMDDQTEITWPMRSLLLDWLVDIHDHFKLLPETLFLAANFLDRFLSCKNISIKKLQLVGATALFIAVKYEGGQSLSVQDIVEMTDSAYIADEVLKAERLMLSELEYKLGWPGPLSFLRRISKADDYKTEIRTLSKYFLEITVMDERFMNCVPSFLSAGCYCLARFMLKKGDWVYLRPLRCW
jgi:G2/mitotic-specific cyclin 3/4